MNEVKKVFANKIITNILIFIFGLILIIFPISSISVVSKIISCLLFVICLSYIINFFINKNLKSQTETLYLLLSILGLLLSIYTFIKPLWLVTTINVIVGIILLLLAGYNIRYLLNYTVKSNLWWVLMLISIVVVIIGIVAIVNPLKIASTIIRFEGIALVINAILSFMINDNPYNLLK